jgi:hypothetical protein
MSNTPESRIPHILENIGILPFTFNESMHNFVVGTSEEIVEPKNLFNALIYQTDVLGLREIHELSAGVMHSDRIVTGPKFYDFLETPQAQLVLKEAEPIMLDVYNEVHSKIADKSTIGGAYGFDACRFRQGQAMLSVLGNCACLGPDMYGLIREDQWKLKFVEYDLHNIEYPAQMISLFAGLGYIAGNAAQY